MGSGYDREYYLANREEHIERARQWAKANPEKKHYYTRKAHLKKYSITPEDYDVMLELQGGVCAVCGGDSGRYRYFDVDHDHECCPANESCGDCIRGLLCRQCNVLVGFMERNLGSLMVYLGFGAQGTPQRPGIASLAPDRG